jgi:ankyrin repeat protein
VAIKTLWPTLAKAKRLIDFQVKDLLNFGADLNYADVEGHSALHFCALYGKTESAKILVSISMT